MRRSHARFAFVKRLSGVALAAAIMTSCTYSSNDDGTGLIASVPYADVQVPPDGQPFRGVCARFKTIGASIRYIPTPEQAPPKDKRLLCHHHEGQDGQTIVLRMPEKS